MTTDNKTLADVQPGGRVRLGDADPMRIALEDALQFVETLHSTVSGDSRKIVWRCLERGRAALSAQPSPGGQDALAEAARRVIGDIDSGDYHGEISEATYAALQEALAARQPVGEPFAYGSSAGHQPIPASIYYPENAACRELYDIPLYAVPPAQAVDMGQFQQAVIVARDYYASMAGDLNDPTHKDVAECDRLLALIDSNAPGKR